MILNSLERSNRHVIDLLSVKDPLSYQVITNEQPVGVEYDPSDEAEIQRMKDRGDNDSTILDQWSYDDADLANDIALDAIQSEIYGEQH